MDTFEQARAGGAGEGAGDAPDRVHCSTGRLTRVQAGCVNAWRDRLRLDRPLPGQPRVGELARRLGATDRPRASCSDAVAAAVAGLLARAAPAPLDLARYAYAGMRAQSDAGQGLMSAREEDAVALYPPVSFYLPAELAAEADRLRHAARGAALDELAQVRRLALEEHPGRTRAAAVARALFVSGEMARRGLPSTRAVPAGALARMAIDRWAHLSPDSVAAAAVAHADAVHEQPHRARADMHELRR